MKILFFGDVMAEHLLRWSQFFAKLGHDVHVITWASDCLDGFEPVAVHRLHKIVTARSLIARGIVFLQIYLQCRRIVSKIRPDLIHVHSAGAYAWFTMFLGYHPFVVSPWGNDVLIDIRSSRIERALTSRALRCSDKIHCDGENTREAVVRLGVDPNDVVLLAFGVDVNKFRRDLPGPIGRQRDGSAQPLVVVSTRTLSPVHDVETLIRSIPHVLRRVPDARFLIVGGGTENDALRKLSESLGVDGHIVFTGHVKEQEMIACLQGADIYVSTSLSESGLAASTAEAMACELPVINTDTGDIKKWIQDENGGFIVPIRKPEVIAERIGFLHEHPGLRAQFGARNRGVILERNNVYLEMKKMEEVYEGLVNVHKERRHA